jgi:hypothetical protein
MFKTLKFLQYLQKNGYEVGKSRTTVDSMTKKMKKRGFVLGLQGRKDVSKILWIFGLNKYSRIF